MNGKVVSGLTIKEVSETYDISADTLRYYERIGMIPEVTRTAGGIRDYLCREYELKQGDARAAVITTDDEIGGRLQEVRLA